MTGETWMYVIMLYFVFKRSKWLQSIFKRSRAHQFKIQHDVHLCYVTQARSHGRPVIHSFLGFSELLI